MKKIKIYLLAIFFIVAISNTSLANQLPEPDLYAETAIVIDTKNGDILFGKDEEKIMYPASTTKILTAILAIENKDLNDQVTISKTAISNIPDGYSVAYLKEGEVVSIEDLLKMLLHMSANDSANALGEAVSGSLDNFIVLMNEKMSELGLTSSNFTNTYGLHDEDHYSSAYDLAMLLKYCISNDTFSEIACLTSSKVAATNLSDARSYTNSNKLLLQDNELYYEFATAGKTGFTTPARQLFSFIS